MTRSTKLVAAENRVKAIDLRKSGLTLEAISIEIGVSVTMVHKYLSKALQELAKLNLNETIEYRTLQLNRLESLLTPVYQAALEGDLQAMDRAVKIVNSLTDLMGCKVQSNLAVVTPNEEQYRSDPYLHLKISEEEIEARIDELHKKMGMEVIYTK